MHTPPSIPGPANTLMLQGLATRWQDAWNRHDMDEIAASISADVDFVTVAGVWLRSHAEFLEHHRSLHRGQMRDSTWTTCASTARLLHAALALQHVEWRIEGDRDADDTPRAPRRGVFTWVVRLDGHPTILAAHNTNLAAHVMHRLPPETTPSRSLE